MKFSDRYKLRVPLGESELGAVWDALDNETDRSVVIVMLEDDAPEALISFFQETYENLRDIDAPGIVEVLDLGITEDGAPYASVEKLDGETLAERLESGDVDFTIGDVVEWVATALEGLDAAHDAGIVHGDIDPACLFLHEADGKVHPKLISWGLNRARARAAFHTPDAVDAEALLRSIAFTSPEQSEGRRAPIPGDDIYGMGAILYDAITGELPRHGRDIEALRKAIQSGPVIAANKVRTDITGTLAATIDRALHQQPKRRPQSAKVMLRGLKSSLGFSSRVIALPPRGGRRSLEPSELAAKAAATPGPAKKAFQVPTPGAATGPKKAQHVVGKPPTTGTTKRSDAVSGTLVGVGAPDKKPISVPTPKGALPLGKAPKSPKAPESPKSPKSPKAPKGKAPAPSAAAFGPEPTEEISLDEAEAVATPAKDAGKQDAGKQDAEKPPAGKKAAKAPPIPVPSAALVGVPKAPAAGGREPTGKLDLTDVEVVAAKKSVPPPVPGDGDSPVIVPKIVAAGVPKLEEDAGDEGAQAADAEETEAAEADASESGADDSFESFDAAADDADDAGRPSAEDLDAAAAALEPEDEIWPRDGDAGRDSDPFDAAEVLRASVPPRPPAFKMIGGAVAALLLLVVIVVASTGGDEDEADGGAIANAPSDLAVEERSLEEGAEDPPGDPSETTDIEQADDEATRDAALIAEGDGADGGADASADAEAAMVATITLSGVPEGASVTVDDVAMELVEDAFSLDVSEVEVTLSVLADGFEAFTQAFVPMDDTEIAVAMAPVPAAETPTPAGRPRGAMARANRPRMTMRASSRRNMRGMRSMRPRVISDPGF